MSKTLLSDTLSFECYGKTDIGIARTNNEDRWQGVPEYGFFALADGMGGHNAGEVAAKEAIEFVCYSVEELLLAREETWTTEDVSNFLRLIYENANTWVHGLSMEKDSYRGMGTTLCSILFFEKNIILTNVGDSRIYRLRNQRLEQLSFDHSLENAMIAEGREEELTSSSKHVLTMAIGTSLQIYPQIEIAARSPSDVYLLCSDGLSDSVPSSTIECILKGCTSLKEAGQQLIQAAKDHESMDNITLVLVRTHQSGRPG